MRLSNPGYDSSPGAVNLPLTPEELDWLIQQGRGALKDQAVRQHLLTRMRNTMGMWRNAMNDLHREISRMQAELSTPQTSSSLNPLDAARYLSDVQKEQLFTGSMRQAWTAMLRLRDETAQLRAQANSDIGRARLAITTLLEGRQVDERLRDQLRRMLESLPDTTEAHIRHIPAPLEGLPDADAIHVAATPHDGDNGTAEPPAGAAGELGELFTPGDLRPAAGGSGEVPEGGAGEEA